MKSTIICCIQYFFFAFVAYGQSGKNIPVRNHHQLAWQQAELGDIFNYDLHEFDNQQYGQKDNRIIPVTDHNIFYPEELFVSSD